MKYSMCADIMFVAPGEHGPVWPDAAGLKAAMELAKREERDTKARFRNRAKIKPAAAFS